MSHYSELKKIHERWLTNPGTSNGQLEDSQTILLLLGDIEKLEESIKWHSGVLEAVKGAVTAQNNILSIVSEEKDQVLKENEELKKNFELSCHGHSVEVNKLLESLRFSDQSFREMEELFKGENKRVKELELELSDAIKAGTPYWKERDLMNSYVVENARLREVLEKIADPRKRDHKEPDAYTELGCVMNIASEVLKGTKQESHADPRQTAIDEMVAEGERLGLYSEFKDTRQDWKETACNNITEALKLGEKTNGNDK